LGWGGGGRFLVVGGGVVAVAVVGFSSLFWGVGVGLVVGLNLVLLFLAALAVELAAVPVEGGC
jgi:hypothetical protein